MNIILQNQKNLNENERYLFIENDAFGFGNYSKIYIENGKYRFILKKAVYQKKNKNRILSSAMLSTPFVIKIFKIDYNLPAELERLINSYL
jgi:hypothetical protein